MAFLNISRNTDLNVVASIQIDEKLIVKRELMNENTITVTGLEKVNPLPIDVNDYVKISGVKFKINTLPDLQADHKLTYQIIFEAPEYTLYDKIATHLGSASFPYYGDVREQLQLIINNANVIDPGWTLGTVELTDEQFMSYENFSCRTAISKAAEQWGLEYYFNNKEINFVKKVGVNTALVFEQGQGKGLYNIGRKFISDKNVKTRVYGFGGTNNLPKNYRNMPRPQLTFGALYKENNVSKYGVKEYVYTNEEIYPKRESTCTAVGPVTNASTEFTITDSTIDFDVNDYLLDDEATVTFLSGELYGENFTIINFNNATKVFTLKAKTNAANIKIPYSTFKPAIGDKFALLNISLPAAYVTLSENQIEAETQQYVLENSVPQVEISLNFDVLYVKTFGVDLNPGDQITINEPRLGIINEIIRVTAVSYPYTYKSFVSDQTFFTATLSNTVTYTQAVRNASNTIKQNIIVKNLAYNSLAEQKRSAFNLRALEGSIFDTDGLFDTAKINVAVLSTALAIVGVKSQNFVLNGVKLIDNYNADPNAINISAGQLIHLEYSNPGGLSTWNMSALNQSGLTSGTFYYIYAVCSKSNQNGGWLISAGQNKVDDIAGAYTFLAGVIYPVNNGFRDTEFTFGITDITGSRIKTGAIIGRSGALEINLETGTIKGDVTFTGSSLSNINSISGTANTALTNAGSALTQANLAYNNAAAVQGNLSTLQNSLGGLAYSSAVQLAQLGDTIVSGGYIKTNLIETNALIIAGGIATQTYAVNQASSYSASALASAQSYASSVATTAGNNALSAAQIYAQNQATQAKADAIANAASNAFALSYASGKMLYRDPEFATGLNGINIYNNLQNGNVGVSRGTDWLGSYGYNLPNGSNCYINIDVYPGPKSPYLGGFHFATPTRASAIFITRLMAYIPVGYSLTWHSNAGAELIYNTDLSGVGGFKEYLFVVKCPTSSPGGFSSTNFFALSGPDGRVIWHLASATVYDMTAVETDPLAYTDTKATATINAAQSYADSVATSKANIAQTAAISTASADATAKANAARSNAVSDSQALINSIQIGAVNILDGSKITNTTAGYLLFSSTLSEPLIAGQQYTFSARIDSALQSFGIWSSAGTIHLGFLTYISGTGIYTITFTAPTTNGNLNFQIYNMSNQGNTAIETVTYYYSKLERGSKRSDWSPSVNDVSGSIATAKSIADAAVTAYNNLTAQLKATAYQDITQWAIGGVTLINGGLINTVLLNAAAIKANIINAGYIESLEIVSKSIRTANAGTKRVEITQITNNIVMYDAANNVLVEIDDDAALEGFAIPGGVPTPIYGPGVRVGTVNANSASLSRVGFATTSGGISQHSIGQGPGGGGSVTLDAFYRLRINNLSDPTSGSGAKRNVELYLTYVADGFGGQVLGVAAEIV